jgi:hypothetical protein
MMHGDTIKIAIALVTSERGISAGANNLRDNAAKALELYHRGYLSPIVPSAPPMRLNPGYRKITLDWSLDLSNPAANPMEVWDDSNKFVSTLPDTHWRRRNPPQGHVGGGRTFEGFRVYRSEYPVFGENSYTLLRQFDIADELNFNGQTGLSFTFTDSNLVVGKRYSYAVTSFTIPDYFLVYYPDSSGLPTSIDTILTQPLESPIYINAASMQVSFAPSNKLGEVKVVPNPYRTDVNYTFEGGGWEGLTRVWNETERVIWFIHLPPKCTVRIFTLAGDLVKEIEHDDTERKSRGLAEGQEEWKLLSESNRAIASGIYVYHVQSDLGAQIGKFVVIR